MPVIAFDITAREPFADGRSFGAAGVYEQVTGRLTFAADPTAPANQAIVDLDKAQRDASGRVRFSADFCLLQPVDGTKSAGRLLMDVANRGRKLTVAMYNRGQRMLEASTAIDPGDGFLFERGWTLAWVGWQWDVPRQPALVALDAPQALGPDGKPIAGQILVQFQPTQHEAARLLSDRAHLPYPAATLDQPDATLYVREHPEAERVALPRAAWRFARVEGGQPVADPEWVWCADGFEAGKIYELVYTTNTCPVVGTGLLAVRDAAAFLRYGGESVASPAHPISHAHAFGMSQSGRFLRTYLHHGLNLDEAGRQVYDGLHIHVAGARRGQFNHRYAQPSAQPPRSFGHLPPYTYDDDAAAGGEGLLSTQRRLGGMPKVVETNTSAEYWRGDAALLHIDPSTGRDRTLPADVRLYHFAGTQHVPGTVPPVSVSPEGARGAHGGSVADYGLLLRSALINLDRWVADGTPPPPNAHPSFRDGTAMSQARVLEVVRTIPGAVLPDPARLNRIHPLDLGPDAALGIGSYPAVEGPALPCWVAAVDADGNERGGVRMPDLDVPVATHLGWNPRHTSIGGAGQIVDMQGSALPFPRTATERANSRDVRPSLAERYASRPLYLDRVRTQAVALAAAGYLLPEDVEAAVEIAATRWEWANADR